MSKYLRPFSLFIKGAAMGSADLVPGVSGGTIALITGIYEELISTIKSVDREAIRLLFKFEFKEFWTHINGRFILPLLAGLFGAIILLAGLITYAMKAFPIEVWSFFFGLILISSFLVLRRIKHWNVLVIIFVIVGTVASYWITLATPAQTPEGLWFILISGMIAITAMILPGISGSLILLLLGKYEFMLRATKEWDWLVLGTFLVGCVIGILSFSRLIGWLLDKYYDLTLALLSGFMIGALNKVWPWKEVIEFRVNSAGERVPILEKSITPDQYWSITGNNPEILLAILFFAVGIGLVVSMEKISAYYTKK